MVSPNRRPWVLWLLSLSITLLGVYNGLLALDNVRHAGYYRDLGVAYPPWLRVATALGWAVLLTATGIGLARRKNWARRWVWIILSNYGAFGVLWLIVFAESDFSRDRLTFQAVLTVTLLALTAGIVRWRRAFEWPSP